MQMLALLLRKGDKIKKHHKKNPIFKIQDQGPLCGLVAEAAARDASIRCGGQFAS